MKITIDSIEISGTDRHGNIEAEVEFHDQDQLIQDIGIGDCLSALDEDNVLERIGWDSVKKYFAEEIQELVNEAKDE